MISGQKFFHSLCTVCVTKFPGNGEPNQPSARSRRSGVATVWLIMLLPVLILLLCVVVDLANLWLARNQAETAMEAAALAAVKSWGSGAPSPSVNWTQIARARGVTLASANLVGNQTVLIGSNFGTFDVTSNPNENAACSAAGGIPPAGNLVFGKVTSSGGLFQFDAGIAPVAGEIYGVRGQAVISVPSLFGGFSGVTFGPYTVTVETTGIYDSSSSQTRLIRVATYSCP